MNPSQKNNKKALLTSNGWIRCPECRRIIARAFYKGYARGLEIKCRCGTYVEIELGTNRAS